MLFDKVCSIAEKTLPILKKTLKETNLFLLDARPQDVLQKEILDYSKIDNFFLPFKSIAVEDKAGLTILIDSCSNQIGCNSPRFFVDIVDLDNDIDNFDSRNTSFPNSEFSNFKNQKTNAVCISFGIIDQIEWQNTAKLKVLGQVTEIYIIKDNKIIADTSIIPNEIEKQMIVDGAIRNASVAFQEIMYFNSPKRFIVEKSNIKTKEYKKIRRGHQRPTYTLLYPHEIRQKLSISNPMGDRKAPASHYRRRHYRTFKADCFKNAKGKTIIISAKWIGASEKTIGNQRYKVMLDI